MAEKVKKAKLKFVGGNHRAKGEREVFSKENPQPRVSVFRGHDHITDTPVEAAEGEHVLVSEEYADRLKTDHPDWFEDAGSKSEKEDDAEESKKKSKR